MCLMLASLLVFGTPGIAAQDATPIAVPTPVNSGCERIDDYLKARQAIMNEMLDGLAVVFPTVSTPVTEHGDELFGAMMVATPQQLQALGDLYIQTADKIAKIEVPAIAKFYNEQIVQLYRVSGATFIEASKTDLSTAGNKYNAQLQAIGVAIESYSVAATALCPGFASVVTLDKTQASM